MLWKNVRTMWELRKDKQAMKLLERLYPHYTNECLACRFHTKKRVMDKFGERYYKTTLHQAFGRSVTNERIYKFIKVTK